MANPNPAHNPTDGLLSAVAVQLSGTGVTAQKTPSTGHPYAGSYSVSLSLAGTSTVVVTPSLVDVNNAAYAATAANWVYRSYNNPQITESTAPAASASTSANPTLSPTPTRTAKIASVGASGASTVTVTALAVGQAIIEVAYPTFDNSEGSMTVGNLGGASAGTSVPKDAIAIQLIVTVGP
jgi:hypothetical protein